MFNTPGHPSRRTLATLATLAFGATALAGCSGASADDADTSAAVRVVAAFYPLEFAAKQLGGERVAVTQLTPPGVEPHDLELTPQQIAQLQDADLVLVLKGFQPAVDDAIADLPAEKVVELSAGIATLEAGDHSHDHAGDDDADHSDEEKAATGESAVDPHVWLDPTLMAKMAQRIEGRLTDVDTAGSATYTSRGAAFDKELRSLDQAWKAGTKTCESRDLVVSHEAFAYLGARYNFVQIGISGLSPDAEPTPRRLADVADFVEQNDVSTIYFETLVDPKVAQTLATETGVTTAALDPIEGLADGSDDDYLSIMRANLRTIVDGQRCT